MVTGLALGVWVQIADAPAVTVRGDGVCPAAAAVEARVADLLGPSAAATPRRAYLIEEPHRLRVVLFSADGVRQGERTFAREGTSCDDVAAAVAVTLSAWAGDGHPELALPPPPLPVPEEVTVATLAARSAPAVPARPHRAELGFALGAGLGAGDGDALAWTGTVSASLRPHAGRWGGRLSAFGQTPRDVPLPAAGAGARASWGRWGGAGGICVRLSSPSDRGDVEVGLALALAQLKVAGAGFAQDRTSRALDVGAVAHARWYVPFGSGVPLGAVAALEARAWGEGNHLGVAASGGDARLAGDVPRWEAVAVLGLAVVGNPF